MFDAFMFRIQQREKVLGKNFKRWEIVILKDGRVLIEDKEEKWVFYDENWVPLDKNWNVELVEIDYDDLPKNVQKTLDRYEKNPESFNFVNVREVLWLNE
jgi:hypothetical protein